MRNVVGDIVEQWIPLIAAVAVALVANGAGYLLLRSQRGTNRANAADKLTGAAGRMVERWEARVQELETKVDELEKRVNILEGENHTLRQGAKRLQGQVESLGQPPVWRLQDIEAR